MEIKCTPQELRELIENKKETPVAGTTDSIIRISETPLTKSTINTPGNTLKKNEELSNENIAVHEENKELRFENEEQKELIDRITRVATANAYNNEKVILSKIKELVNDYQSIN